MRRHVAFAIALLLDLLGAAVALLASARTWQTITTVRPAPLHDDVLHVAGRTVDAAPTALALVALAGVVAVVATRGLPRRAVGVVLVLAGIAMCWRALSAGSALSVARARALVVDRHPTVDAAGAPVHVHTSALEPTLTLVAAVLIVASGVLITARGHRWQTMSARYETPAGAASTSAGVEKPGTEEAGTGEAGTEETREETREKTREETREQTRARTSARLWSALDRGEDPTR